MSTPLFFTTVGDVRGGCGHRHRSLRTAVLCCAADTAAIRRRHPGGEAYSDRSVRVREAGADTDRGLTQDERDQADAIRGLSRR